MMTESQILLAEYVKSGSGTAFQKLVLSHFDLVYSVAFRLVDGDAHLAKDVAQTVFIDLARLAKGLSREVRLGGWLHRHTCFVAAHTLRGERRRKSRERQAAEMNALQDHSPPDLAPVASILDEAINQLGAVDRTAILLRFFERLDFRSVGLALGSTEAAAQKRVARALEKLHAILQRRGFTCSATALGTALASEAVTAAPTGLALSIATTSLATAAAGGGTTFTLIKILAMTKLKAAMIGTVIIAGVAIPLVMQHNAQLKLREQNRSLHQQVARLQSDNQRLARRVAQGQKVSTPRLPAPPMPREAAPAEAVPDTSPSTKQLLQLLNSDKPVQLKPEQLASYLNENRRSAASLLAAFRATGDPALLQEAMQKYPDDPQVAFAAIQKKDASPEEQRQWLDAFKKLSPDNALANYLSAINHLKAGQTDQAVQELIAASGKPEFQDFSLAFIQDNEDAFRAAGYSEAETKVIASVSLLLPQLAELKQLNQHMVDLAKSYRQGGDETSAQAVLQMGVTLGQHLGDAGGYFLLNQLVGNAIERIALGALEPTSPYGQTGQTVGDRITQLAQQNRAVRELTQQVEGLQERVSPQDWISYVDRVKYFGEAAAAQWLIGKY